jgi:putative transposase
MINQTSREHSGALIERPARENPSWGYERNRGELRGLGIQVSRAAIQRRLRHRRIGPAPERDQLTWRRFLQAHAATTPACDFAHVDCAVTLKRVYVFFVIELETRHVHLLGITANPDGAWDHPGRPQPPGGQGPAAMPTCERLRGTLDPHAARRMTDRMLILGERHLRRALAEYLRAPYLRHCNEHRPHRGLDLISPLPSAEIIDLAEQHGAVCGPAPRDPRSMHLIGRT